VASAAVLVLLILRIEVSHLNGLVWRDIRSSMAIGKGIQAK
jgi:hypothetical protein